MTFSFSSISGRLCPKQEPERGCLKKVCEITPPKDSTPILSLPPEVRACIFKYLIDDVDLTFKFSKSFENPTCWAKWLEYHRNLSFLKVCSLFEAEALALVQVEAISIEIDPPPDPNLATPAEPKPTPSRFLCSAPQPIALTFSHVRPYLRQLSIDARYTLGYLLDTDLLQSFPKLKTIRVKQTLWPRDWEFGFREKLNNPKIRQKLIKESVGEYPANQNSAFAPLRMFRCRYDNTKLCTLLDHPKLKSFYPLLIDVMVKSGGRSSGAWASEDGPSYPISRDLSALRFTFEWPSRRMIKMEVDMFNQPMALAIKSEWTETVSLVEPLRNKVSKT